MGHYWHCGMRRRLRLAHPTRLAPRQAHGGSMNHTYEIPEVRIRRPKVVMLLSGLGLVGAGELLHHLDIIATHPADRVLMYIWTCTFAWSMIQLILAWRDKPWTVTPEQQVRLDRMRVTVNIPVYNEDPELIDRALF